MGFREQAPLRKGTKQRKRRATFTLRDITGWQAGRDQMVVTRLKVEMKCRSQQTPTYDESESDMKLKLRVKVNVM